MDATLHRVTQPATTHRVIEDIRAEMKEQDDDQTHQRQLETVRYESQNEEEIHTVTSQNITPKIQEVQYISRIEHTNGLHISYVNA